MNNKWWKTGWGLLNDAVWKFSSDIHEVINGYAPVVFIITGENKKHPNPKNYNVKMYVSITNPRNKLSLAFPDSIHTIQQESCDDVASWTE